MGLITGSIKLRVCLKRQETVYLHHGIAYQIKCTGRLETQIMVCLIHHRIVHQVN